MKGDGAAGQVDYQYFTFAEPPNELPLDSGVSFGPITLAYQTYGQLNPNKSNAVLILHALSGDSHVAGSHVEDGRLGWWDSMVGPGKAFDTDRYFIICPNVLGGCKGSTGPASIDPQTGKPYGLRFPVITIGDMVRAQVPLIDHLGIDRLLAVTGGSMGGMQALEWAVSHPQRVRSVIPIATTARLSAQGIAFNEVGRRAIMADPNWRRGDYYEGEVPAAGLSIARQIAHITYLSDESMHQKFGRRLRGKERYGFEFSLDFEVESYLQHQGSSFVKRFDANSYLYITKAIDYFDLANGEDSLARCFRHVTSPFLVISYTTDWLYPTYQAKEIVRGLKANNVPVSFCEIEAPYGHDSFLIEVEQQGHLVSSFLARQLERAEREVATSVPA